MTPAPPHIFAAMIERMESGVVTHVVPVPAEIAEDYIAAGHRRVLISLNGAEVRRYLFQAANGQHGVMIGKSVIRQLGLSMHEPLVVELRPDPDPEALDLCEELLAVLEQDKEATTGFYALTLGGQRNVAFFVNSAKRSPTRIKRALEMARKLRTNTLYGDRK